MYPVVRLLTASTKALFSKPIEVDAVSEISFRCRPWDIDMFLELNNGRVLTLYDLGRFDFSIRMGLARILKENKWGLVVAGASIRYRQRVRMFDKVTIRTHVDSFDDRWIYVVQSMWVKGQPSSSILLRTGVTSKGKVLSTDEVLKALSIEGWKPEPVGWVKDWIRTEQDRDWPP